MLLSTGKVDVSAEDNFAIKYASYGGHLEIVKLLLSTGKVDVTAENNFAIRYASRNKRIEVVEFLLSTGKIDVQNITDVSILYMVDKIKLENKTIDVEKMTDIMKKNKIIKIAINGKKIQLTTKGNVNTDSSEIIEFMNKFNIVKCEYDDKTSKIGYKITAQTQSCITKDIN